MSIDALITMDSINIPLESISWHSKYDGCDEPIENSDRCIGHLGEQLCRDESSK